jgi:hypothetical protein
MPKAKKPAAQSMTKSDFIRKFSATTAASDIVTKAKAVNLKLTPSFVYAIRAMDKKRQGARAKKASATTMGAAASASAAPSTGRSVNKSAFVRGLPSTMSATDVIAKGKAEGIKLTAAQVYTVRANAKRAGSEGPKGKPGPKPGAKATKAVASPVARSAAKIDTGNHDHHFVSLVLNIGLARAEALLARVRDRVTAGL